MPGNVAPVNGERDNLLAYLAQQRYGVRLAAFGLTDDQARATPTSSQLSVGGLIKHVTATERNWIDMILQRPAPPRPTRRATATTSGWARTRRWPRSSRTTSAAGARPTR